MINLEEVFPMPKVTFNTEALQKEILIKSVYPRFEKLVHTNTLLIVPSTST